MTFKRTADLSVDTQMVVHLTVSFEENDTKPDEFRITVRRYQTGPIEGEAIWHVKERDGNFSLQITTQTVMSGVCLAGCFADVLTGPLADCLTKAKTKTAVRNCITQHGFWQAVKSLYCIYKCLSTT